MSRSIGELTTDVEPPPIQGPDYSGKLEQILSGLPERSRAVHFKLGTIATIGLSTEYGADERPASYRIAATTAARVGEAYRRTDAYSRNDLERQAIDGMVQTAYRQDPSLERSYYSLESHAMMNNSILLFEPYDHAMLVGNFDGRRSGRLNFIGNDIETREQRHILLGGLARFLTALEQQKS